MPCLPRFAFKILRGASHMLSPLVCHPSDAGGFLLLYLPKHPYKSDWHTIIVYNMRKHEYTRPSSRWIDGSHHLYYQTTS